MSGIDLSGKVALVTGASAGVGRAYALALAGAGATVVAAARRVGDETAERNTLAEVVQTSRELPGRVHATACDVTVAADIERAVDEAVANHGRLDVLVNNAGAYPRFPTFEITDEQWDGLMELNLRSAYRAIRRAAPHMIRQQSGAIINITAGAGGFFPKGHGGHEKLMMYALTKAALNRLTTYMAEELKGDGVAVNALSPGVVRTDIWAETGSDLVQRSGSVKLATPEALGPALLHLAAPGAGGLNGQVLHTDEFGKSWGLAG